MKVLHLSPYEGGLGLPDFYLYYLAAQSMVIWAWQTNRQNLSLRLQIDQHRLPDINLSSLPYIPFVPTKKTKNLQSIYTATSFLGQPCST